MSSARELAVRASGGDAGAFSHLVGEYSGLVYRVALRILGPQDAQDASQEAWIRAWRNIENFRGDSAFSTWLYRITVNTCLSARRKESRRKEREYGGEEVPFLREPTGGDADPEAAALNVQQREERLAALEHLRTDHRPPLAHPAIHGLSYGNTDQLA